MPDIVLRIHSKGQDPHEITAPDDIVTEEFLTELVKGLRLPQSDEKGLPIVWEADDKDNGQLLAPGRSLAANGVRAGHNIYLRQKAISPPVVPPPITKPTPPPTPPGPSKWPLWLSLLLIPVAGVAGFYTGSAQETQARAELQSDQTKIEAARKQTAAAEARAAQLGQQLDQIQHDQVDKDTTVNKLKADIATRDTQLVAKDKRLAQLADTIGQLHADAAHSEDQIKKLEAAAQKVPDLQSQFASLQRAFASLGQKTQPLQQEVASLQQQLQYERSRPRYGFLTWTGDAHKGVVEIRANRANIGGVSGSLPGIECVVEAVDPERVEILTRPGPAPDNKWSRLTFRLIGNSKAPVRLVWSAR